MGFVAHPGRHRNQKNCCFFRLVSVTFGLDTLADVVVKQTLGLGWLPGVRINEELTCRQHRRLKCGGKTARAVKLVARLVDTDGLWCKEGAPPSQKCTLWRCGSSLSATPHFRRRPIRELFVFSTQP